LTSIL